MDTITLWRLDVFFVFIFLGVCWTFWICGFIIFTLGGKILATFLQIFFFLVLPFFSFLELQLYVYKDYHYPVNSSHSVSHCFSVVCFSLYSWYQYVLKSMDLSAVFSLLLISTSEYLISYYNFQVHLSVCFRICALNTFSSLFLWLSISWVFLQYMF